MSDDVIEQLTKQIKAMQKKIDALEAAGADDTKIKAYEQRIESLEARLASRADFGDWD